MDAAPPVRRNAWRRASSTQSGYEDTVHVRRKYSHAAVHADHAGTSRPTVSPDSPHVIVRGERLTVWDSAGQAYLDATSGMFCTTLGYTQPRLVKAAADQMARLPFYASFAHRTNDVVLDLADELAAIAPMSMGRTLFANSGAEAVDSAIELAWYYHRCVGRAGRAKIISHQKGYHGTTVAAGSVTGLDRIHLGFEMPLPQFVKIACPDHRSADDPAKLTDHLIAGLEAVIATRAPTPSPHSSGSRFWGQTGSSSRPRTTTAASSRSLPGTTSCSSPTRSSPVSAGPDRCPGPRNSCWHPTS